ncbi:MAG: PD40 domain-containing protein [Deferribacteres bacterium]|nr:PD40 domain-containing protein [Deferribacteres bacterium]
MFKPRNLIFLLSLFSTVSFSQTQPLLLHPSINKDGSKIAFSYQGDIWTVSSEGGRAERLTEHEGIETASVWSPSEDKIAFNSERFGNSDVYVVDAQGGIPVRLTYHSTGDDVRSWAKSGKIYFTTNRNYRSLEWTPEIYTASPDGGTPERVLDAFGYDPAESPDGRFIAFVRGDCRLPREEYHGAANRDIWLYDKKNKTYTQLTKADVNDFSPEWGGERTLFFISAASGKYNIHKISLDADGGKLNETPVTTFKDNGVRNFRISADGTKIVFERDMNLYTINPEGSNLNKLVIDVTSDYKLDPYKWETLTSNASSFALSPNGKYSALAVRGDIFVTENNKDKKLTINLTKSPSREENPQWINDSTLVFISDEAGQFDIYAVSSSDSKQTNLFKSLKHKIERLTKTEAEESALTVSPDGKRIAFLRGKGQFITAQIDQNGKMSNERILSDDWAPPEGVSWSPDSKWLAYSKADLYFNDEIFIQNADSSGAAVNISMHPRSDSQPFWSADGSKLGFVSERNNRDADIWFVWLKKTDWEKTQQDWEEFERPKEKKDKKDSTKVVEVTIDFVDIYKRLVQVTSMPGDERNVVLSADGETFYFTAPYSSGKAKKLDHALYSIKWDGKDFESIIKGGEAYYALAPDKNVKNLYFFKGKGALAKVDLDKKKEDGLSYAAKMQIDFTKEREQIFEESWRMLRDHFYDPGYNGHDWEAIKKTYKPWVMAASTSRDFRYMFNFMLGQINASHMGMYGSDREETQKEATGLLGIEIENAGEGVRVVRVVPESPADKKESKLVIGDIITKVNGEPLERHVNFYAMFAQTAEERVLLEVKSTNGKTREVIIRPVGNIRNLLYNEWVMDRKKLTQQYSNGRLGYIHIRAMGWEGFEEFERELTIAGYGKEGIVVDVRYNGGGWTTDFLMTVLNYKQHAYTIPRGATSDLAKNHQKFSAYYPLGERLPYSAWIKPSIALCNENSYSNAEIFSHAYKTLGIGKLVGKPTFGAVISTSGRGMVDGTYVRMPFRGWYVKKTGNDMEDEAATPDFIVDNAPDYRAKGSDAQLKKAVEELLKQLQ